MPTLDRDGEIFLLHLDGDSENRFHPDWLAAVEAALEEVERAEGNRALVTVGSGKFWSNGLDLAWLAAHPEDTAAHLNQVHALLARTLASPVVTVAALNGHTFAGGGLWALAHDFRVMRADRGYFCLPEVDIEVDFQRGMSDLVRARLTPAVAHQAMTTGKRYGGEDAVRAGIADEAVAEDEVLGTALRIAGEQAGRSKPNRGRIKEMLYAEVLESLAAPTRVDENMVRRIGELAAAGG